MPFKHIHFIINPASGKEEPILSFIQKAFKDSSVKWEVTVTREENDAFDTAEKLIDKTDLIVVYGGDGSITQVARALKGTKTPMAIIPGGTANVMSKELGIPQDSEEALRVITDKNAKLIKMDTGEANGSPFLLRINFGIMADMILEADEQLKNKMGQMAYGVTVVKTIANAKLETYRLIIDGKEFEEEGVALTITNAGNTGIGDFDLFPGISITDGLLDVLLLKDAGLLSMLKITGTTLFQTESDVLKHWRCKTATVIMKSPTSYILDDCKETASKVEINIIPLALNVLVPAERA
ncbi:diacylglycerol/lipid kinase family protein [Mucilaginibacter segetis]|uniref:Diacylglycerol kinase family lipid kinase n=1 Tax=Mucilaginibacter segetis TaxID=2793071 RepID=A0A934PQM1_9SPHI|nr:diacylglycerol kinase family protein [Mucilaginibacter segetis]MBK0377851.1 diacylglycerol kinase family lipid kinase [Mucilaginibacter segetis]